MIDPSGLLMIEPKGRASSQPVIDELTRRMAAAWRTQRLGPAYRGVHHCACGVTSDHFEHFVTLDGRELLTNSLCIHYLAFHRKDVPRAELDKVRRLAAPDVEPTEAELRRPSQAGRPA
jgi:hypothetical protein